MLSNQNSPRINDPRELPIALASALWSPVIKISPKAMIHLREKIESLGKTDAEIAREMDCSKQNVNLARRGIYVSLNTVRRFCLTYEWQMSEFDSDLTTLRVLDANGDEWLIERVRPDGEGEVV